jgi:ferredoxin
LKNVVKIPVVELSQCNLCEVCVEVCPVVFKLNEAGYIEVAELSVYPPAEVDEAIKNCPSDCIYWAEIPGKP